MRMANRHRQRVGRVGPPQCGAGQQTADHHHDLLLLRPAGADHREFHRLGGILGDRNPGQSGVSRATPRAYPSFSVAAPLRLT